MAFHRLVTPSYFILGGGALPAGYDMINTPSAVGGTGVPALTDGIKSGGPNDGTYFVAFGEDAESKAANRANKALAENTDYLDNLLRRDLAVPTSTDLFTSTGEGSKVLSGASVPIFVGMPGTANTATGLRNVFQVLNYNHDEIIVSGARLEVDSVSPGGAVGTFYSGSLTLNFTAAIPPGTQYRIYYGTRGNLAEVPADALTKIAIRSAEAAPAPFLIFKEDLLTNTSAAKGTALVGAYGAGFVSSVLTAATGGGLGDSNGTLYAMLTKASTQLVARRAFTAVHTDGVSSSGGDVNSTSVDSILTGTLVGGLRSIRRGNYEISGTPAAWDTSTWLLGEPNSVVNSSKVSLAAARVADLTISAPVRLESILLASASTTARYRVVPADVLGGVYMSSGSFESGALSYAGTLGGRLVLEDVSQASNVGFAGTTYGLEITGEVRACIRRTEFRNGLSGHNVYLHDIDDSGVSSLTFEDCIFYASSTDVESLRLLNVYVPVTFKNCKFINDNNTAGVGYAVSLSGCTNIVFDNCLMHSDNGQVLSSLNSGVTYRDCRFTSGVTAGLATSGMVVVYGGAEATLGDESGTAILNNCHIIIGASSLRGAAGVGTSAVVELGGAGSAPLGGVTTVANLHITYEGTVTLGHNYSTVLLHGYNGAAGTLKNRYSNIEFDCRGIDHTNAGALNGMLSATACLVEVGGATQASRDTCLVDGLSITRVASPSVSHARHVLYAKRGVLSHVTVDGAATAIVAHFSESLVKLEEALCKELQVCRQNVISCNATSCVTLGDNAKVVGGFFNIEALQDPTGAWVELAGAHAELHDYTVLLVSGAATTAAPMVYSSGSFNHVANCLVVADGDPGIQNIVQVVGAYSLFNYNRVHWNRNNLSNQIFNMASSLSTMVGNIFMNVVLGTPPTYGFAGNPSFDVANSVIDNVAISLPA